MLNSRTIEKYCPKKYAEWRLNSNRFEIINVKFEKRDICIELFSRRSNM